MYVFFVLILVIELIVSEMNLIRLKWCWYVVIVLVVNVLWYDLNIEECNLIIFFKKV